MRKLFNIRNLFNFLGSLLLTTSLSCNKQSETPTHGLISDTELAYSLYESNKDQEIGTYDKKNPDKLLIHHARGSSFGIFLTIAGDLDSAPEQLDSFAQISAQYILGNSDKAPNMLEIVESDTLPNLKYARIFRFNAGQEHDYAGKTLLFKNRQISFGESKPLEVTDMGTDRPPFEIADHKATVRSQPNYDLEQTAKGGYHQHFVQK